jgi:hypothetical protein
VGGSSGVSLSNLCRFHLCFRVSLVITASCDLGEGDIFIVSF